MPVIKTSEVDKLKGKSLNHEARIRYLEDTVAKLRDSLESLVRQNKASTAKTQNSRVAANAVRVKRITR